MSESTTDKGLLVFDIPISRTIFRNYDIRGVADVDPREPDIDRELDLTPDQVWIIGKAFGTWVQRKLGSKIVIARDNRGSSLSLAAGAIMGMLSTGCQVFDIGLGTTPMLYFAVDHLEADGGVMITGSHNPMWSNGLKLSKRGYQTLVGDEIQELYELIKNIDFMDGVGTYRTENVVDEYMTAVRSGTRRATRPLKVIVDPGNAVGALVAPQLLTSLGYDITTINGKLKYPFPKGAPDPEQPSKVEELAKQVINSKADIGIAYDGDADRIGVIDEKGKKLESDLLLLLYARDVLREHPGAEIVFDVKCTDLLIEDVKLRGGIPIMSKTGHSNIKQKMQEDLEAGKPALLGGELSGHMFFKDRFFGFDDAIYASCRILEILSQVDTPFSALLQDIPEMFTTRELALPTPDEHKEAIVSELQERFRKRGLNVIDIDGARIDFGPHKWALVRMSNTQPKLTARFQAEHPDDLKDIVKLVSTELQDFPMVDISDLQKGLMEAVK